MRQLRDDSVVSNLSGGLNLNSTPNSMELTDATILLNADPLDSGGVKKRPGTRILYRDRNGRYGVGGTNITTPRKNSFIVTKEGTALVVYFEERNRLIRVVTKTGVFRTEVLRDKPFTFSYQDTATRALFLLERNAPTQLSAYEYSTITTQTESSLVFTNTTALNGASSSSVVLIGNGYAVDVGSVSYNGTTNTTTLTGTYDPDTTYQLLVFTWQWWGEAMQWYGDNFYATSTRLNTDDSTDLNVSIPESIRTNIEYNSTTTRFPILAYSSTNPSSNTYTYNAAPSTDVQYAFSDGTLNTALNPTPFWISFGDLLGDTAIPTHLIRLRELPFKANTSFGADDISVHVNETTQVSSSTTSYGSWQTYDTSYAVTSGSTASKYIAFDKGNPIGVSPTYTILVVNKVPTFSGSSAVQTLWQPNNNVDGSVYAVPGLGLYANYLIGRFPTFGTLYEERLVLGGFSDSSRVVFSALYGTRGSVRPYAFFQNTSEYTLDSDPFDLVISSSGNEYGTALIKHQNSLYFFTNKSVTRIFRQDGGFTSASELDDVGAINPHCVVSTSQGLFFLHTDGVYTVVPINYANDYKTNYVSQKVRPVFDVLRRNSDYHTTAWLSFDTIENKLFVGIAEQNLPVDYSHRLYVLHLNTMSWSEYYTYGFFRVYCTISTRQQFCLLVSTQNNTDNEPVTFVVIRFEEYATTLDFIDYIETTEEDEDVFLFNPVAAVNHVTNSTIREYGVRASRTTSLNGFDFVPLTFVEDITVILDGGELIFGTDYIKLDNGNIWLLSAPLSDKTLTIYPKGVL